MPPTSRSLPKPKTFDDCLAALAADQRAALEKLRRAIHAAAPGLEECISYGLPAFRLNGKFLVAIGAAKNHCAFYLGSTTERHTAALRAYDTSKGTIRFQPDRPLPAALVRKLVRARLAEQSPSLQPPKPAARSRVRKAAPLPPADARTDPAVSALLSKLDHPLTREFEQIRQIILGSSPEIHEGIKWNAPSFRTSDWFATVNLRSRDQVQLIFHLGAKVKSLPPGGLRLADPAGLIKWLAQDRCMITLGTGEDIATHRPVFEAVTREWIRYL